MSFRRIFPTLARPFLWPFVHIRDARDLRRLRRAMRTAYRGWVLDAGRGPRPESDAEYLARLRRLARERSDG